MARISTYGQDGTPNKLDKVLGTDSATGSTKNYTIDSMLGLVNEASLVDQPDGSTFQFQDYVASSFTPSGVISLNAGTATTASFSAINQLYISILDKTGLSIAEYLENADNDFIKISKQNNVNQFGIFEVTAIASHDSGTYKLLTVTPRGTNGNLTVGDSFFVSNYSALYDQDFSDDSITEFSDVTSAGSGAIITTNERISLTDFTNNGLVNSDVVNTLTSTAINVPLSAAQGKALKDLIDTINTLLEVDTEDAPALDTLREIVNFCQTNASTLSALGISSISGLSAALTGKEDSVVGKGLSTNDFTAALKLKLDNISEGAEVNVQSDWTSTNGDSKILNKPTDLTNLSLHGVTDLSDVTSAGSGAIITSLERTKLTNVSDNAEVNVQANWSESDNASDAFIQNKPALAPSTAEQNVQSNWNETDNTSDTFIQNKPTIPTNTNTTYDLTVQDSGDNAIIRLTDSDATNDDLTLIAGSNVTLTPNAANVTIDVSLSTGAVADGVTTLTTGDQVFDYLADFARTDIEETFTNNVIVQGNLTVSGTTTTINSNQLNIGDSLITLNSDLAAVTAPSENSGVEINRGSSDDVALIWNEGTDKWQITDDGTNYNNISVVDTVSDLSDTAITSIANNQILKYNSTTSKWENQADAGGIQLTDLSIGTEGTAAGDGDISYDNTTGIFTYSPPDLSTYIDGTGTAGNLPKFSDADTLTDSAISEQAGAAVTLSLTGAVFTTGSATLTLDNSNGGVNPSGGWSVGETFTIGANIQTNNGGFDFGAATTVVTITSATATGFTGSQFNIPSGETATYVSGGFTYSGSAGATPSKIGINKAVPNVSLDINGTDSVQMPSGTTAERPAGTNGMFRYNTEDSQFEGYTDGAWGAIAGGGGAGGTIVKKTFSGNGSTTAFVLDDAILSKSNVDVYISGTYQFPSNYEVSGSTVTFDSDAIPPTGTDNINIVHVIGTVTTEGSTMQKTSFTGDGTTSTFPLGDTPQAKSFTIVHIQGIYQESATYSISGSNIVFTTPIANGHTAEVTFIAGTISVASLDVGSQTINSFTGNGTATFNLGSNAIADKNYTDVYINGVYQAKDNYSLSGTNIVFTTAPLTGYDIEVKCHSASASNVTNSTSMTSDVFTANGLTSTFPLVNGAPTSKEFTMVFVSGIYQQKSAYNLSGSNIVFDGENPAEDDTIEVITLSSLNNTSSPVASVNGQTGAVVVASKHDVSVISSSTTAVANTLYVFTANLNLTLPASPESGDSIKISNRSAVATCQLLRNGSYILGVAGDLTLDTTSASFELVYTDAANGWVIIGQ